MKFIHCADVHLDSKINELPEEKRRVRREEILSTFEKLCVFAVREEVSAVIVAGDLFDSVIISQKTLSRVLNAIKRASTVDFLYLPGNHENNAFLLHKEIFPTNLKCFNNENTSFNYDDVSISGIITSHSNRGGVYKTLPFDKDKINILVMHGRIVDYKTEGDAEIISLPLLRDKNVDYLALGHYHSFSSGSIDSRGVYAYSGCLDGRGFDELGEKGFVLIEVVGGKLKYKFKPFCSRTLHEIAIFVDGEKDFISIREKVLSILKNSVLENSLVKVVLTGERLPDTDLDIEGLIYKLNEIYFYAKVTDKTSLKICVEDYKEDKSVRGEFVRLVLSSNMPKETIDAVIRKGLSALKGE